MTENRKPLPALRVIAVILMGLTVLFTLMAGAGTTCVAFAAEKFGSMAVLVPYKWLYQLFVVVSLATGVWGIPVLLSLVRGGAKAYRNALIVLVIGALTSGVHMSVSQAVRGASAPANMRFYITAFTLLVFLLLRLPPLWARIDFTRSMKSGAKKAAGGAALIVCGLVLLTTYYWTAPTHLAVWIDVLRTPILVGGWGMLLAGSGLVAATVYSLVFLPAQEEEVA
ncbi:MAG: hypothetical protein JXR84_17725 [Anaerolineae bacterium]|nr:hypothetical protein [Anaerolineae bacterium]